MTHPHVDWITHKPRLCAGPVTRAATSHQTLLSVVFFSDKHTASSLLCHDQVEQHTSPFEVRQMDTLVANVPPPPSPLPSLPFASSPPLYLYQCS